ncbi:TetR/AcrR family transcriptional regulator [Actinoplanes sp. NPDC048988]|uniref:TetR/AcrR family transcriptional regulator n=1 Tax=Actinoplanes sp. NPDC048988 TaxID=3363901 RepID=UPI0037200057
MARTEDPSGRQRILAVAAELFYVRGVRAVGLAEVIQAAGCGKNMLYRHFPGKSALVAAYLVRAREEREAATSAALTGEPRERLVALVSEVAQWVRGNAYRGCAFRRYLAEFPARDDEAGDEATAIARGYLRDTRAQVDDLVAAAGAAPLLGDRLWLLIDSLYSGTGPDPSVAVAWARELSATPAVAPADGHR